MERFSIKILGVFEVWRDSELMTLSRGKIQVLLASLALCPQSVVSHDQLVDRLWSSSPPSAAAATLRGHVKRLRRLLDDGASNSIVESVRNGYRLNVVPDCLDFVRFEKLRRRAVLKPAIESRCLDEALALWRGPVLADVFSDSLQREAVPGLHEQYMQVLYRRIEIELQNGRYAGAITLLKRLVAEDPLQERFWEQLVSGLHRDGRRAEAMSCYHECRDALASRLGVDPGPGLRELYRRILIDDPMLQ